MIMSYLRIRETIESFLHWLFPLLSMDTAYLCIKVREVSTRK